MSEKNSVTTITQGQQKRFLVTITDEKGVAKDLSGINLSAVNPAVQSLHPLSQKGKFLRKTNKDAQFPLEIITASSQVRITLSEEETRTLLAEPRQTIFLILDFPQPLGRQVFKIEDAYSVCSLPFDLDSDLS